MQGWIKLHRQLLDSHVFTNEKLLKIWIWCLLKAVHTETELLVGRQVIKLIPGQFVTGRHAASTELGMAPSTTWDYLQLLKRHGYIDIKSNNKFSVVTVVNWAFYQGYNENSDSKIDNKSTANGQQIDTNKNIKNEKKKDNIPFAEIIDYLNSKTGKNFKHTTKKTQSLIRARLNEGFTIEDLRKVIDTKVADWKGTEYEKYLRPETLFGTKFEAYLNQKPSRRSSLCDQQRLASLGDQVKEVETAKPSVLSLREQLEAIKRLKRSDVV